MSVAFQFCSIEIDGGNRLLVKTSDDVSLVAELLGRSPSLAITMAVLADLRKAAI